MSEPLVIIGQGMAATKLVEELSAHALGRYSIIVIGKEPCRAYNRVLLSSLLAGEIGSNDLELKPADWWQRQGITNIFGRGVAAIDREGKQVTMEDGTIFSYEKLVLATGSYPVMLPIRGMNLPGVLSFRVRADVEAMIAGVQPGRPAVVIGGGLLGIEAAYGLAQAGVKVTLIHLMDRLMERQLDASAAELLAATLETKGVEVLLRAQTARIVGNARVEAVELADGQLIPADLVVCAIGIRPNADLARAAGLEANRGILIDDGMRTSDPSVFALGECAEHQGIAYGLVEPAYEQARILARRLAGDEKARYPGSVLSTHLKVSGVSVFSAGDFLGEDKDAIIFRDEARGIYKKLVVENDHLTGAVLYGDTSDGLYYLGLMRSKAEVPALRHDLIFGPQQEA
ncbi:NAD(P)/FAD-dependent oxidoreductase [Methyloferula stellata]|uniref:NAD(P)/FAD-dependent oxidoreductase n=1 Tax=Methyloferula stellata TaxID=876270 RepID=UPI0003A07CCB|nr:FAD-dependent oxidoreductase [Methyloferula stellata]